MTTKQIYDRIYRAELARVRAAYKAYNSAAALDAEHRVHRLEAMIGPGAHMGTIADAKASARRAFEESVDAHFGAFEESV